MTEKEITLRGTADIIKYPNGNTKCIIVQYGEDNDNFNNKKQKKEIKTTAIELRPNCHYILKYLEPCVSPKAISDFVEDCKKYKIYIHLVPLMRGVDDATIEKIERIEISQTLKKILKLLSVEPSKKELNAQT